MDIKEKALDELKDLDKDEILQVLELMDLYKKKKLVSKNKNNDSYLSVREVLKPIKGVLSEEIIAGRAERIRNYFSIHRL